MIDYKLAKELKDAGFPILSPQKYYFTEDAEKHILSEVLIPPDFVPVPTLSELIEACGEDFEGIIKRGDDSWDALFKTGADVPETLEIDKTPIEAVARLWLALNKK